jgi:DNA-binding response OmpR family regulator
VELLDLGLPHVSGLELCRQIRGQARDVYLPIIILTGAQDSERGHQGFAARADDYITKPFAIADLLDRVRAQPGARQRLQAAHAQTLQEQERSRQLNAQLAQDEAVLAMARTTSHELNQPLT